MGRRKRAGRWRIQSLILSTAGRCCFDRLRLAPPKRRLRIKTNTWCSHTGAVLTNTSYPPTSSSKRPATADLRGQVLHSGAPFEASCRGPRVLKRLRPSRAQGRPPHLEVWMHLARIGCMVWMHQERNGEVWCLKLFVVLFSCLECKATAAQEELKASVHEIAKG